MSKVKNPLKDLQKKRKSTKTPFTLNIEALSSTPSLKLLTSPSTVRSTAPTRDTQSQASSPHAREDFRSIQPSPSTKDSIKIDQLLKYSLKRFKSEKSELAKIKEFAQQWKNKRKRKIQEYNLNTRIENKAKSSSKNFRPSTAWASPDIKDRLLQTPQVLSKQTASSSVERRANIGLEFYNLKSPRNTTPKNLQEGRKMLQKEKKVETKKKISDFIKKKRKERRKEVKKIKEQEEEYEVKRLAQLIKLERTAKQLIKTHKKVQKLKVVEKKKPKKTRPKKESLADSETAEILNKKSMCYSEDEEVLNIMQVRKLSPLDHDVKEGRQCLIFGNSLDQSSRDQANPSDLVSEIEKIVKSEELSLAVSPSTPIIELKSISHDSSSEPSDKRLWFNGTENNRFRLTGVELTSKLRGAAKFLKYIKKLLVKALNLPFTMIKCYQMINWTAAGLSKVLQVKTSKGELKGTAKKLMLDEMLNQCIQSCENSEDLEGIWEKFEANFNNFNKSSERQVTLTSEGSIKTGGLTLKTNSDGSLMKDDIKGIESHLLEISSFTNHRGVIKEGEVDFSSQVSISRVSDEFLENKICFSCKNCPGEEILKEEEPQQSVFQFKEVIFILGEGSIVSDKISGKENSLLSSPESEEIEEFNSMSRNKFANSHHSSLYAQSFGISESTLSLEEDEIIEATIRNLIKQVYLHLVSEAATEFYRKPPYKFLTIVPNIIKQEILFTSQEAVMLSIKTLWQQIDLLLLEKYFRSPAMHLCLLGNYDEELCEELISKAFPEIEDGEEEVMIHNMMLVDTVKKLLLEIHIKVNPPFWKAGTVMGRIDFEQIFVKICKGVEGYCRVESGKIPNAEMITGGVVDEQTLQSAREQGLENILAFDIEEEEHGWADYWEEEQQNVLDLADFIFSDLIDEIELLVNG